MIDSLKLGESYPLRDLPVPNEKLKVPHETPATISIQHSQQNVLYQLYQSGAVVERIIDGQKTPVQAAGDGGAIQLETDKIIEDVTFDILAVKQATSRQAWLHQTATVKVGLNTALPARIRLFGLDLAFETKLTEGVVQGDLRQEFLNREVFVAEHARIFSENQRWRIVQENGLSYVIRLESDRLGVYAFLDQTAESPGDEAPRLINYGAKVEVQIDNSQEGVVYQLVSIENGQESVLSESDMIGDLHNITLVSKRIFEDVDVYIRATKNFGSGDRAEQKELLDAILPLKVRANSKTLVAVDHEPIFDFDASGTIKIPDSQSSVNYQVFMREISDREFVHGSAPEESVIKTPVENQPDVQVEKPARTDVWSKNDFTAAGEPKQGNDGDLRLSLPDLQADHLVIVKASKDHDSGGAVISSALQLEQAVVVLVRPNPMPSLRLETEIVDGKTGGQLHIFDGDPGIFYQFSAAPENKKIEPPVYFHKRDEINPAHNKGLSQLKIGVDFVVPRTASPAETNESPTQTAPEPPVLETEKLAANTELHIKAMKAQTLVENDLSKTAIIAELPEIALQDDEIETGATTKILVKSSVIGEKYEPFLNGQSFKRARNGNGADLSFNTDPITEDTEFEVRVTQIAPPGFPVMRIVKVIAKIRLEDQT